MRPQLELDDEGSFLVVEDEADRVMPSRTAVLAAARYDLHHAIQYCGGYTAVRIYEFLSKVAFRVYTIAELSSRYKI